MKNDPANSAIHVHRLQYLKSKQYWFQPFSNFLRFTGVVKTFFNLCSDIQGLLLYELSRINRVTDNPGLLFIETYFGFSDGIIAPVDGKGIWFFSGTIMSARIAPSFLSSLISSSIWIETSSDWFKLVLRDLWTVLKSSLFLFKMISLAFYWPVECTAEQTHTMIHWDASFWKFSSAKMYSEFFWEEHVFDGVPEHRAKSS